VCLWVSDVVRAELAVEMMIGVTLGIALGTGAHRLFGSGPIAITAAVFVSVCAAVPIGATRNWC
jgi:uncharacterized membrane protein YgaE (UPF0421/DUF939 family)